jgi:predicted dehydrogenase
MKKKYTAAVLGCGRIGFLWEFEGGRARPATHIAAFLKNPRIKLVGGVEVNAELRKMVTKHHPRVPVFADAKSLFRHVVPDIVSVASPDELHLPLVRQAAEAGVRLIICEKPIAPTVAEAEEIVRICKEKNVILLINHMRRFDPVLARLRVKIKEGLFGRIQQARCLYVNGLLNNGTHTIDLLRWYFGEVAWVMGFKNSDAVFTHKNDYNVDGIVSFKNGLRATLQSLNAKDYYLFEQEYYGTKGAIFARNLGLEISLASVKKKSVENSLPLLDFKAAKRFGNKKRSYFRSMAEHAVLCLDGKAKPASTGEDGLMDLKVLIALRKSAERHGEKILL